MEAVFSHLKGVQQVTSGYAGGDAASANYDAVSSESTRHAEAIRVIYDPRQISYATLLRVYFSVAHNPTEVNRQGPDSGTSYRSAIFPQDAEQVRVARTYIAQLNAAKSWGAPIATRAGKRQVLSGGSLSSGLRIQKPQPWLYPHVGCAQGRSIAENVPDFVERQALGLSRERKTQHSVRDGHQCPCIETDGTDDFGVPGVEPAGQRTKRRQDQLGCTCDKAASGDVPAAQRHAQLGMKMT